MLFIDPKSLPLPLPPYGSLLHPSSSLLSFFLLLSACLHMCDYDSITLSISPSGQQGTGKEKEIRWISYASYKMFLLFQHCFILTSLLLFLPLIVYMYIYDMRRVFFISRTRHKNRTITNFKSEQVACCYKLHPQNQKWSWLVFIPERLKSTFALNTPKHGHLSKPYVFFGLHSFIPSWVNGDVCMCVKKTCAHTWTK